MIEKLFRLLERFLRRRVESMRNEADRLRMDAADAVEMAARLDEQADRYQQAVTILGGNA